LGRRTPKPWQDGIAGDGVKTIECIMNFPTLSSYLKVSIAWSVNIIDDGRNFNTKLAKKRLNKN